MGKQQGLGRISWKSRYQLIKKILTGQAIISDMSYLEKNKVNGVWYPEITLVDRVTKES